LHVLTVLGAVCQRFRSAKYYFWESDGNGWRISDEKQGIACLLWL